MKTRIPSLHALAVLTTLLTLLMAPAILTAMDRPDKPPAAFEPIPITATQPEAATPTDLPVWAIIELASQGQTSPGRFDFRLHRDGWLYVLDAFEPAYKAGGRVLALHRPNGDTPNPGQPMNLDARVELLSNPEARKVLDGIPQFLEDFEKRYPGARIVAYFGTSQEPDLIKRLDTQQFAQYLDRYARSLIPWINSPIVDIAFDHAGSLPPRDPHGQSIMLIDAMLTQHGRTVYIEPQPRQWSVTADLPFLVQEYWWQRWADKDRRNGIRWLDGHSTATHGWWTNDYQGWVDACIRDGMGMAIHPSHFPTLKLPLNQPTAPTPDAKPDPTKIDPDEKKKAA